MAGSWRHMTTDDGKLLDNEGFVQMIENLGDAYEAAEECFGMIWWLAQHRARLRYATTEVTREQIMDVIESAREHYTDGVVLGGTGALADKEDGHAG